MRIKYVDKCQVLKTMSDSQELLNSVGNDLLLTLLVVMA